MSHALNAPFRSQPHSTITIWLLISCDGYLNSQPRADGMSERPQTITLGETRASGVRGLLIYCTDYHCSCSIHRPLVDPNVLLLRQMQASISTCAREAS